MTTLSIGRIQALTGYGLGPYGTGPYGIGSGSAGVWSAKAWDHSGDKVALKGAIAIGDVPTALAVRQQLLGYLDNPDERVVPVVWGADPSVDGFYRVLDAQVAMHGPSLVNGFFDFTMGLERLPSYSAPFVESVLIGTVATNDNGITAGSCEPWHAVPAEHNGYSLVVAGQVRSIREGDAADVAYYREGGFNVETSYWVDPVHWYDGAATLRIGDDFAVADIGAAYGSRPIVIGRQAANEPRGWILSNELLRMFADEADHRLWLSPFDGLIWETPTAFVINVNGLDLGSSDAPWKTIQVLRNGPEEVIIRLTAGAPSSVTYRLAATVDLSLRRGSRYVSISVSHNLLPTSPSATVQLRAYASTAATALTGGIRATSNDAGGNRWVMISPRTAATNLAIGSVTRDSVSRVNYGLGFEVGGSGSVVPERATDIVNQYHAFIAESVLVGAR